MQENLEDRIRERAHAIWEAQGYPEGLAEEHWRQAAEEVAQVNKLAKLPPRRDRSSGKSVDQDDSA